jgi:PAS domain S-box-containing protein
MVYPDDQQRVSDYLLNLVPGDRKTIDFRIVTPKQEIRWVSEKSQCKAGSSEGELVLLGAVTDITERKQAEEMLRESEKRFRNIAEMLPEVVFELDLSGNLIFANRKAYEIFGYSEEAFARGLNAFDMIAPEERDIARKRIHQRLAGREVGAKDYTALRKDGSTFPVLLNAIPIFKDLEPVGIIGIMTDITARKSNEIALVAATKAAESASRAKDLFLAKMSHEIRTPLTAIIGFSELLEDSELLPLHKNYLSAIRMSGSALASLVDDLLDLSKIETGKLNIRSEIFSLHKLITELVATVQDQLEMKKLSISSSIDTNFPDLVVGDPLRIQQVLLNLLNNAIKFTEKGDIDLSAFVIEESTPRVLVDIAVKDSGVGIATDFQEKVFEPFVQGPNSKTLKDNGSGLGLTISRNLATLMGGSIRLESRESVGSTFHLVIPLQRKVGQPTRRHLPVRESSWNGPALNILLAEDNPRNILFMETCLKNMKHAVTVAEDGKAALDAVHEKTFDVVFMDIQMPVISGEDVLRVIRDSEQTTGKHLTVIALTAYALLGDKEKYLNMGFDGYLSKPITTQELLDELKRVLPG